MYKFISWNVNGLRAVAGKGFADIFEELDADFFCLQETKLQEGQIDLEFLGYRSYWNYADKKGYSGTAIYTKHDPINVSYGIGIDEHDHEGRAITLEMEDFYLVCVYVPNSQDGLKRLDYPSLGCHYKNNPTEQTICFPPTLFYVRLLRFFSLQNCIQKVKKKCTQQVFEDPPMCPALY